MEFNRIEVVAYLKKEYPEERIDELIKDEIVGGDWLDDDWEEEYETEHDWYENYGSGEAEAAVKTQIEEDILKHFSKTKEDYLLEIGEEIFETIDEYTDKFKDPLEDIMRNR